MKKQFDEFEYADMINDEKKLEDIEDEEMTEEKLDEFIDELLDDEIEKEKGGNKEE